MCNTDIDIDIDVEMLFVSPALKDWIEEVRRDIPTPYVNFADPPPSPSDVAIATRDGQIDEAIMRMLRDPRRERKS